MIETIGFGGQLWVGFSQVARHKLPSGKSLLLNFVQVALLGTLFLSLFLSLSVSVSILTSGYITQEICSFQFLPEKRLLVILWLNKFMYISSKQIFINGDDSAIADDDKERVVFLMNSLITLQMHLIFTVNACFHNWKQIKQ